MSAAPEIASRLKALAPSATVAVAQRAAALRKKGVDVLSFSVGEPDFPTPMHICQAAKKAVDDGATHYTAVRGIGELLQAICDDSKRRRGGIEHSPSEVVVSVGAKHTLFNLAFALFEPGDEVIVPAPYWVSYPEQVRLVGAEPVIVETSEQDAFRVTPPRLEAALTSRTKAVILCSPSNPTGSAYTRAQLFELMEVLSDHSCWIIADEIYGRLVYDGFDQRSVLEVAPELRHRIILVDGVSKTFAMTGWRIGWMLGPASVAKACETLQSQSTTNPTAVAQYATIAALTGSQKPIETMRHAFEQRRNAFVAGLNAIEGIRCRMPEGAFYAFCNVESFVGRQVGDRVITDDLALASYLLEEARVAVVPGVAFGAPGFLRLSYAASLEVLNEGLRRMQEALSQLVPAA